jgi:hypothetical protein
MVESVLHWASAHASALRWLSTISLLTFVGTLLLVPAMAARIPEDYFSRPERRRIPWAQHHPLWRAVLVTMKNLLGATIFLFGLALLVLPGQGLLTMAIGITLLDFPGKYRVERWLVGRAPLLRAINALRLRAGKAPLDV